MRLLCLLSCSLLATGLVSPTPKCGMLVVGLAGNNGVTLLAGQIANRKRLTWESSRDGPRAANCLGCITQVGALADQYTFAPFSELVVGGWDVVPTKLGDALYRSRVLDYDLVRQVRDEMDGMPVMRGVWDPEFYGDSQAAGATHIAPEATRLEQLARLREDIRSFKVSEGLTSGHTTVVWSASVERPCEEYERASELLAAIVADDKPNVSPSLLYATAALLEGCSFVNGGSQNTVQPALVELAAGGVVLPPPFEPSALCCGGAASSSLDGGGDGDGGGGDGSSRNGGEAMPMRSPYVLGTDFKAGQTKAKTAIVEYLRALGLKPRTIASYNHLGNNDMKNLLSPRTWKAKARVKTDVFGAWSEADGNVIDHQVAVLYTEQMGDEKRDTVEYTSEAFMGCEHTMLTYTRCMDSALCVPLMIDAVIFCDYFYSRGASPPDAARAIAYLFKLNEGGAVGVDPGFFNQSAALAAMLADLPAEPEPAAADAAAAVGTAASDGGGGGGGGGGSGGGGGVVGSVLCAGLSCVDMMLLRATDPATREAIAPFQGCEVTAGGSASNSAMSLRAMGVSAAVLTCAGQDGRADELAQIFEGEGIDTTLLLREPDVSTSLAVLPVFESGGRGCWVDLSANERLTPQRMLSALRTPEASHVRDDTRALLVGYPHLLKGLQGDALRDFLAGASELLGTRDGDDDAEAEASPPIVALDVNGATLGAFADADGVLGPALPLADLLHANLDEAMHIAGVPPGSLTEDFASEVELRQLVAAPLLAAGVAVVAITLGGHGAYVAVTSDDARLGRSALLRDSAGTWRGRTVRLPALPLEGELNANGAGDAFTSGMLAAMLWRPADDSRARLSLEDAAAVALGSARQRVDSARRGTRVSVSDLLDGRSPASATAAA